MLRIYYKPIFLSKVGKVKDNLFKERIEKLIIKISENPEIGKPMRNLRKGTREIYIKPFRLSYAYLENENKIILLDLYHKKKQ